MSHLIGVDGGTESLRAMVFDPEGRPLGSAATPYETRFPRPGWAEQDPEDWWRAIGRSVPAALADAGVSPDSVAAMAVDTTCCSVVALDESGAPVRPALIWMDVRAADEAEAVLATGDSALELNGGGAGPVSAEWMLPKALWLRRNEPENWARAVRIGEYQDFMTLRLTGSWTGSLNNATVRWHWRTRAGGAPSSLLNALGIPELEGRWPSPMAAPGTPLGGLTRAAAAHIGLPEGLPVIQGGVDAQVGAVGLGVCEPGEMALITGSSHLQLGIASREVHRPGVWGTYMDALYPGRPVIEGGQTSTGSVVAWFKRHFARDLSYDQLNAMAAARPIGSDGLTVLDHFQGNRTPWTDPASRGAITGLSLGHDEGHVFRAIIEGVCMGTRIIVDAFGDAFTARRIVVAGGAVNSPLWLQIHADTLGAPIVRTEVADAPLLGCAAMAAAGIGMHESVEAAARAMVREAAVIEPDPEATAAYEEILPRYVALYEALKAARGA